MRMVSIAVFLESMELFLNSIAASSTWICSFKTSRLEREGGEAEGRGGMKTRGEEE